MRTGWKLAIFTNFHPEKRSNSNAKQWFQPFGFNHGFNLSVSPHDLTLEEVSQVTYCFKCYAIDDHLVKACTKPQSYRVCSLCSSKQHTYKDCTSTDRKCINCNGAHATMSKSCPSYKVAAAKVSMELPPRKTGTQYPPVQCTRGY